MTRRLPSPARQLVGVMLLAPALVACGSSSAGNGVQNRTPAEIVAGAKVLADAASSVHVHGSIVSGGSPITLNLFLLASKGGRGQLSEDGLPFEVIQIHGTAFIKGSSAFYSHVAGPSAAQLLQGRWLKASATSGGLASLASLTNLRQLLDATLTQHGALVKGQSTTVGGKKVIAISDLSGGGTLYVAQTGPPYPIEVVKAGAGAGSIVFDDWNGPLSVIAPTDAIDINQLESKR